MLARLNSGASISAVTKFWKSHSNGALSRHLATKIKKKAKSVASTKKKATKRKVAKTQASSDKSANERLPTGLYVVGTPIGNMSDITKRALKVLKQADLVCCEDTRVTGLLMSRLGIKNHLSSVHQFTAPAKIDAIVKRIRTENAAVAIVSDAGTPLISDPGSSLVTKLQHEKLPVYAVPGPSAVTAALSVTGFPAETKNARGEYTVIIGPRSAIKNSD